MLLALSPDEILSKRSFMHLYCLTMDLGCSAQCSHQLWMELVLSKDKGFYDNKKACLSKGNSKTSCQDLDDRFCSSVKATSHMQ